MKRSASNSSQLGFDLGGTSETHRLFFALWPSDALRVQWLSLSSRLKTVEEIAGDWLEPSKYHATLHFLGDSSELRSDHVEAARRAVARIERRGFDWSLDRVDSFHGTRPPCVLRSSDDPPALLELWQQLREALILEGLGKPLSGQFTAHVTLAYARRVLPEPLPIEPIHWPVDTLALIHSSSAFQGYRLLEQWRLAAMPA